MTKNNKSKTIAANYLATIVSIIAPVVALPFYVKILGIRGWGLLSFVMFAQASAQMFEAGWGQAVVREVSYRINAGIRSSYNYVKVIENIYLCVSVLTTVASVVFIKLFPGEWVGSGDGWIVAMAIAVQIALVFPNSLYRAILISKERQIKLSCCSAAFLIIRHGLAIFLVGSFPRPEVVVFVFLAVTITEVSVRRFLCGDEFKVDGVVQRGVYLEVVKKLSKISIPVLVGILATQSDKIIVGYFMSAEDFGIYAIASTVAAGLTQVSYPVIQAYVPLLIKYHSSKMELLLVNKKLLKILSIQAFLVGFLYIVMGEVVVGIWLRGENVDRVISILNILIIGTILNFFYNIAYNNWIAKSESSKILASNCISIALLICITPVMIYNYGINGAGCGWVLVNFVGIFFYVYARNK